MGFFDKFKKTNVSVDNLNLDIDLEIDESEILDNKSWKNTTTETIPKFEMDYLKDEDLEKIPDKTIEQEEDFSDIMSVIDTPEKIMTTEKKEEQEKQLEQQVKKEVKASVQKSFEKQFRALSPRTKATISNLFLIFCLWISIYLIYGTVVPVLKQIAIYKTDIVKIQKDYKIVESNLKLLQESTPDAFEYRRLTDLLEQAVPLTDKYEDNIIVVLNLLKDSTTKYSKSQKLLQGFAIKPNVEIKDLAYFQLDWERILGIEYSLRVDGFEKYQYIKDFLVSIDERLKVFHVQSLGISKVLNKETQKIEYSVWFTMYSYYKVPKIDEETSLPIEKENIENTFN